MAQKAEGSGIIERGNIYFLYRPKVQQEQARTESSADIFRDLKLDREKHPLKPLFEGKVLL